MEVTVYPGTLSGSVAAPVSKSAAHRALICAALADGPTVFSLPSTNDDIEATLLCLTALGTEVQRSDGFITIQPLWNNLPGQPPLLDCGESGSTLRFLLPVAAALGGADFAAHGRLRMRPLSPLREELEAHGCTLGLPGHWPLSLRGGLCPGNYKLSGDVSSQYFSGLLLALPLLGENSWLHYTTPLQSSPYAEMTRLAMEEFGVEALPLTDGWLLPGGQRYRVLKKELTVEGDWSAAAFWLVAGALGGPVAVKGLSSATAQGDRAIVNLLVQMGAQISHDKDEITVQRGSLSAFSADFSQMPDLVPIAAVAAALAQGKSTLSGASRLRDKESDRLAALTQCINALGGSAEEKPDGLVITGRPALAGGTVDSWNDHRIAMAMAVAALGCTGPVTITGAQAVSKSYPGFFEDYEKLGGRIYGGNHRQSV